MGKAKANNTPSEQLPLDDPRWTPLDEVVETRARQTGHFGLATLDLEEDQKSGRVRGMRRNIFGGEREYVVPSFWREHFSESFAHHVVVYRRNDIESTELYRLDDYGNIDAKRLDHWMHYVWQPDVNRRYSAVSAQAEHDERQQVRGDAAVLATRSRGTGPKGHGPKVLRLQRVFSNVWPNGVPAGTTEQEVLKKLKPVYKEYGWDLPKRDVILRALGLR